MTTTARRPHRTAAFHPHGHVDIAVLVVTYNSAADLGWLMADLRREAADVSLRVIVADNNSRDATWQVASGHPDAIVMRTGGNLGYAGALNAAMTRVGDAEAVLVLNPDLRVQHGAVTALLRRLRADATTGAVVPLIEGSDGHIYHSLRREPGVLRATADAALGRAWPSRPSTLSEYVRTDSAYRSAHPIDWATGAALLVRTAAAIGVGLWDESFFLYSEETDFQRRLRDAGWRIWFEPAAIVTHHGGGSGVSSDLVGLTVVNRVRYMEKHAPSRAAAFRAAVMVGEELRRDPTHARARWALRRRRRWDSLPHAQAAPEGFPEASVIIPAHNEAAVIGRTLERLAPLVAAGRLEVIVVCNGCTDDTAARAAAFSGVTVIESPVPSKTAALNLGDTHATRWPRFYLDADIELPPEAIPTVVRALADGRALAARPSFRMMLDGASASVRSYYRARSRMPSTAQALWGAGVYALSRAGHERLGTFPDVTADDVYVDRLFLPAEKALPVTVPVDVRPPLRSGALLSVLTRMRRGPAEQNVDTSDSTARALLRTIRGPLSALDAITYAAFAIRGRRRGNVAARSESVAWERDDTSRGVTVLRAHPDTPKLDHVILTRFNLPTPGPESLVRAREGWLRDRVDLFERYTVPSLVRQSVSDFRWIVYLDPESPYWLIERLRPHVEQGIFTPVYRESVTWQDVARDVADHTGATGELLLTTNLDNDDAVADDFVERLQRLARTHRRAAIYLANGLIARGQELYLRRDEDNAFCSVVESWDAPQTAWRDWHTLLHEHFPTVSEAGDPAWLQVVHGGNVSNRVRGTRADPATYRRLFGEPLQALPAPGLLPLAADRFVRSPLRGARDGVRAAGKRLVLTMAGKDGLDRVKQRLQS